MARVQQGGHAWAAGPLAAALVLTPLVYDRAALGVFTVPKLAVLWSLGLLGVAVALARCARRGSPLPPVRLAWPVAALLLAVAAAAALSDAPVVSLLGRYGRYGGLAQLALFAAIAASVLLLHWEGPQRLGLLAAAVVAGAGGVAASVLLQHMGVAWFPELDVRGFPLEFPGGTMGSPNVAGAYLGVTLPLTVARLAGLRRWWPRVLAAALLASSLAALWLTQSRAGMLAAVAGVLALGWLHRAALPPPASVGVVVATVLVVAGLVAVVVAEAVPGPLADLRLLRTGTLSQRRHWWVAAWRLLLRHPLLGTGPETFPVHHPAVRAAADGAGNGLDVADKPHNVFLEYGATTGVAGLAAFLVLMGLVLWVGWRGRSDPDVPVPRLLGGFVAVVVAYLVQAFFLFDVPVVAVVAWVALGAIAAIADPGVLRARRRRSRQSGRGPRWWAALAAVVAAVLAAAPVLLVAADRHARASVTAAAARGHQEAARAIRLHPLEGEYRRVVGQWAEARATGVLELAEKARLLGEASERYRQACRLQGWTVGCLVDVARVHTTWARELDARRYPGADRWWRAAISLDPTDWEVHELHARMLVAWAAVGGGDQRLGEALVRYRRVAAIRPDRPGAWVQVGRLAQQRGSAEEARRALERALRIDRGNEEALRLLATAG